MKNGVDSSIFNKTVLVALVVAVGIFVFINADKKKLVDEKPLASQATPQEAVLVESEAPESLVVDSVTSSDSRSDLLDEVSDDSSKSEMTLAEFSDLTYRTLNSLPTRQSLRSNLSDEELHETPQVLQDAGYELGEVAQALHDNPDFALEAAVFYRQCFQRSDFVTSVRSLCLADHRNLRIAKGDSADWTPEELDVPNEVRVLAEKIPTN